MVEDSIATFETFCRHQDMVALAAEQDIANQYREVVRAYVDFADANPSSYSKISGNPPIALRWRNAGLRAIKAVVSTDGLAADGGESLRITLPVILGNLYTGEDDVLPSLQARLQEPEKHEPEPAHRRRASAAAVPTVDTTNGDVAVAAQSAADVDRKTEMDVRLLALRCLERIVVSGSNRGQIRIATGVVLRFILSKGPLRPNGAQTSEKDTGENWATSLIELVAKWCPVQIRFVILVTAMELLMETQPTEKVLEKPFTIVYLIDWLLKSQVNMIGLSVMDVLLGLMHYISLLVTQPEPKRTRKGDAEKQDPARNNEAMSAPRKELLSLLQTCIGNLATHIYYGDQVADLVKAILSRFKPSGSYDNQAMSSGQDAAPNSEMNMNGFFLASAKVAGLKAIKNILIVANLRRPMSAGGVESRDHIGIHIWEGTQWLLRAPERDVRFAYADAFLSYLKLETSKHDLRLKDEHEKRSMPKREPQENGEVTGKRAASSTVGPGEKAALVSQSNFLRLLHLTIYDHALECATDESEISLLHLLLASLIENLGVNAVRFGLPMTLKLQDDMNTVGAHHQLATKVNIGSLSYGYLWGLSEKFGLEGFKVGGDIRNEIGRRKRHGLWLQKICLPPLSLDNIVSGNESFTNGDGGEDASQLSPFQSAGDLVDQIEDVYNSSAKSPAQSPPSSPGRGLSIPVPAHATVDPQKSLPADVKDQMLAPWSREVCLAAVEQENAKAMSLSGSRVGTMAIRGQNQVNGERTPSIANSPIAAHQGDATGMGESGPQQLRRVSVPELSFTPAGSSRGSPVRVNELRRVLSVNENRPRRLSPLRGRLDASNNSIASSSSESVVSGAFSVSDAGEDGPPSRRQSTRGGQISLNDDGMDTPRASTAVLPGNAPQPEQPQSPRKNVDGIPPVPPIPPSLSLPGGFPNDSPRSQQSSSRPSSAPGDKKKPLVNGRSGTSSPGREPNILDKRKSRSITGLAIEAGLDDPSLISGFLDTYGHGDTTPGAGADNGRRDIEKLLSGSAPPDTGLSNGVPTAGRFARRSIRGGGIGRPPY